MTELPKRTGISGGKIPVNDEVVATEKVGGYWFINRRFPFLHFEKERLYVFTKSGMYQIHEY